MAKNILVATPQTAFGELLRLSLEESGRYRVRLVSTGREALSSAEQMLFALAIVDAALGGPPFTYVVQGLRKRLPSLPLLIIPTHADDPFPEAAAVDAAGWVSQPFYAPGLLEKIAELTQEPPAPVPSTEPSPAQPGPTALPDASLATRHLEQFLQDSTAPGVLVVRMRQPWASAGELNQEALNEVANLLSRYTESNEGVGLARYVHLKSDGGEYLIYATPLNANLVLALVYQISTPLTIIRTQAARLAQSLRQALPAVVLMAGPAPTIAPPAAPVLATVLPTSIPNGPDDDSDDEDDGGGMEAEAVRLADLLSAMPQPNPDPDSSAGGGDWVQTPPETSAPESSFLFPWERQSPAEPAGEQPEEPARPQTSPTPASEPLPTVRAAQPAAIEVTRPAETAVLRSTAQTTALPIAPDRPIIFPPAPPSPALEQTRPSGGRGAQALPSLDTPTQPMPAPSYTCVLVPKLPEHQLVEPLSGQLGDWLPHLCQAYGWRMDGLAIQPDYLQWSVQVAPSSSPGNMIRLVRQQTSRWIFAQYPHLELDNSSGDFWAPGYLIISGNQPSSYPLVQDFIHQARLRQSP
jgi:CheY-like chemotaxis protein/REP element-mobilizing transposase RayT